MFSSAEVTLESFMSAYHEPNPNAYQVCISGLSNSLRSPWSLRFHVLSKFLISQKSQIFKVLSVFIYSRLLSFFACYFYKQSIFLYFSEEPHFRNEITTMCMLIIFNRNVIWMAIAVTTTRQWDSVMKAASESLLYFVLAHLSANKHDWSSWVDPEILWQQCLYCNNQM